MNFAKYIQSTFTWNHLILISIGVLVLYVILRIIKEAINRFRFPSRLKQPIERMIEVIILIIEPLFFIWFISYFLMIQPFFHGAILLFALVLNYRHIVSYLNGIFFRILGNFRIGNILESGQYKGNIVDLKRLQVGIHSNNGVQYIDYGQLIQQGFSVITRADKEGNSFILVAPKSLDHSVNYYNLLKEKLAFSPYVDLNHIPEIHLVDVLMQQYRIVFYIEEENQLNRLVALIEEWGFNCTPEETKIT